MVTNNDGRIELIDLVQTNKLCKFPEVFPIFSTVMMSARYTQENQ